MLLLASFVFISSLFAQDASLWMQRGVDAFQAARYPDAVAAFERAVAADPANVSARLYLGTAYMQQYIPGQQSAENQRAAESAAREFQRVLDLEPENPLAIASIANLLLRQKKWDESQQWFEKLAAADPTNADAYYSLGFIAWSKWFPAYAQARATLGMRQQDPGPMPYGPVKQDLKTRFESVIEAGLLNLRRALEIKPDYADAMAYSNLLVREWADVRDTKAEYLRDIAVADEWVDKALAAKKRLAEARSGFQQPQPPPTPDVLVSEEVALRFVVRQPAPVYPPLAKQGRIQGTVRLRVIIDSHGAVVYAQVISGHPLLIPSALDAVKQWQYNPTMFNAAARYAATDVSVNYTLQQ